MLRWQNTPDEVFQAIIRDALEFALDTLQIDPVGRDENFRTFYPRASGFFGCDECGALLKALLKASDDDGTLYQLTDYHWLLLYESLKLYTEVSNELYADDGLPIRCGRYRIGRLDFDGIVDCFFWDMDFLVGAFAGVPEHVREQMGVNPETWGMAQGLKPHPEELLIQPVLDGDEPRHPMPWSGEKGIATYPLSFGGTIQGLRWAH
jgi:hypothetical protein